MNFRRNSYGPMAPLPDFQGNSYGPMPLKFAKSLPQDWYWSMDGSSQPAFSEPPSGLLRLIGTGKRGHYEKGLFI